MTFNFLCILIFVNLNLHQSTGDPFPSVHRDNQPPNYASNTPFLSEPDMESFIRNEWRDYATIDLSTLINPLKEILYTSFNPNQTKIRVCSDLPFSTYKEKFSGIFQPSQIYVNTPSLLVPLKYFKWAFELMTILNDDVNPKLTDTMIVAMRNLNTLDKDGDSEVVKFMKNCQATVIVPRLFRSNYCVAGPIIDSYFPSLANISLIQLGGTFLRYNSVKKLVQNIFHESWNDTLGELENIPISNGDEISFENLRIMIDSFQKNLHSLYLKIDDDDGVDGTANDTAVPLSHWAIVYDALNTDVGKYLKLITSPDGSKAYESLPFINYRQNTTTNIEQNDAMLCFSPQHTSTGETSNSNDAHMIDYCTMANEENNILPKSSENLSFEEIFSSPGSGSSHNFVNMAENDMVSQPIPITGRYGAMYFSNQIAKKKSATDFSTELNPLLVGQDLISPHQRLLHHVGQTKNKDSEKTTANRTTNISIFNPPFTYLGTDRLVLYSPYSRNPVGPQSRVRHRPGFSILPKQYRVTDFKDTESKKLAKKITDLINYSIAKTKNRNSKSALLNKGISRDLGRNSIPISDHLVSSVRKNDNQPFTSFTDSTLIEELQNTFDSSRV